MGSKNIWTEPKYIGLVQYGQLLKLMVYPIIGPIVPKLFGLDYIFLGKTKHDFLLVIFAF